MSTEIIASDDQILVREDKRDHFTQAVLATVFGVVFLVAILALATGVLAGLFSVVPIVLFVFAGKSFVLAKRGREITIDPTTQVVHENGKRLASFSEVTEVLVQYDPGETVGTYTVYLNRVSDKPIDLLITQNEGQAKGIGTRAAQMIGKKMVSR